MNSKIVSLRILKGFVSYSNLLLEEKPPYSRTIIMEAENKENKIPAI